MEASAQTTTLGAACNRALAAVDSSGGSASALGAIKRGWTECKRQIHGSSDKIVFLGFVYPLLRADEFDLADEIVETVLQSLGPDELAPEARRALALDVYATVARERGDLDEAARRSELSNKQYELAERLYKGAPWYKTVTLGSALSYGKRADIASDQGERLKAYRYAKLGREKALSLGELTDITNLYTQSSTLMFETAYWNKLPPAIAPPPPPKPILTRQLDRLRRAMNQRGRRITSFDLSDMEFGIWLEMFRIELRQARLSSAKSYLNQMYKSCLLQRADDACYVIHDSSSRQLRFAEEARAGGPRSIFIRTRNNSGEKIDLSNHDFRQHYLELIWRSALHSPATDFDRNMLAREFIFGAPGSSDLSEEMSASPLLNAVSKVAYKGEDPRAIFLERVSELYPTLQGGRTHENLFTLTQGLQRVTFHKTFSDLSARTSARSQKERERRRALQDRIRQLSAIDAAVVAELEDPDVEDIGELREERFRLEGEIRQLQRPSGRAALAPAFPSLTEMRTRVLHKGEAVLSINSYREGVFLSLITSDGVTQTFTRTKIPVSNQVTAILAHIDAYLKGRADQSAFPAASAASLYQVLFYDLETPLAGIDTLIVVPDPTFASLPLDLLITRRGANIASHQYLADRFSISVIPSLAALRDLRLHTTSSRAQNSLLTFSDPAIGSVQIARAEPTLALLSAGKAASVCDLKPVPATRAISAMLMTALGKAKGVSLSGEEATEEALFNLDRSGALDDFRIIAFNTHGLVAGDLKDAASHKPALVLTPEFGCLGAHPSRSPTGNGLLDTDEIASLSLDAELVLLTACNTASGGAAGAPALTGLAEAFFYAGARRLLVSHWPAQVATNNINQGPAEMLIASLAQGNFERLGPKDIQSAKRTVRNAYPHPAQWATFSLVSSGL